MKAMILAAGEGRRMAPLTDTSPKPMLSVAGRPLIEHHLRRLREAGVTEVVVNVAHLAEKLIDFLGDGSRWDIHVAISRERQPLETAGGIIHALSLLGDAPFLVVNGDIYTDYPFEQLVGTLPPAAGAHLILVANPAHNRNGDFLLKEDRQPHGQIALTTPGVTSADNTLTYSGMGIYCPALFSQCVPGKQPLKPVLDQAIARRRVTGELFEGVWEDVGTPDRLAALNRRFPRIPASQ